MSHPESVTAVLTDNEPPNGTVLFVKTGDDWKVIERDDAIAAERDAHPDDCWFDSGDTMDDPMSLYQHVKYADAVYALGDKLAEFR